MIKMCVFIPATHLDGVKNALFEAGAGKIGDYDRCSWETLGRGQFRPLSNSQPFIGESGGGVEWVDEYKVEMVFADEKLDAVVRALREAHPYEEPAFDLIQLLPPPTV